MPWRFSFSPSAANRPLSMAAFNEPLFKLRFLGPISLIVFIKNLLVER